MVRVSAMFRVAVTGFKPKHYKDTNKTEVTRPKLDKDTTKDNGNEPTKAEHKKIATKYVVMMTV